MNVLITGGAGFIGSHLADRLVGRGDRVVVIDNFATARRDNLPARVGLDLVEASIADAGAVTDAFGLASPEVVVHAAASYKDPGNWAEDAATNVVGTANVVKESSRRGVGRLLYFQTALCYGLHPSEQPITIDHPLDPRASSYAISKTAGEHYVGLSELEWVSFRLANAYGPRNLSGPLPVFYQRLSSGAACFVVDTRRDFIYVDDLVDVVMQAIDGAGEPGVYHISSGSDYAIKDLFEAAAAALAIELDEPVEVRPRDPDDAFTILLDPTKTVEQFDWRPRVGLGDGVAAAIDYYREHGIAETFTHLRMAGRE
jgi:UDP-glucose 4-epimerase